MLKKLLTFCCAILMMLPAMAQGSVSGTVTDPSGKPLSGVVAQVLETQVGTITDDNGAFTLRAASGQTIEFSCLGMKTVLMAVPKGNAPMAVSMVEDTEYLDELVVVGYGTTKKRDLAGSIASIKSEDVKAGVINNPAEVLRGRRKPFRRWTRQTWTRRQVAVYPLPDKIEIGRIPQIDDCVRNDIVQIKKIWLHIPCPF